MSNDDDMMLSNQCRYQEDEWEECGDVGFVEHGADDSADGLVSGDVLSDGLAGEVEDDQQGDEYALHLIFMICQ